MLPSLISIPLVGGTENWSRIAFLAVDVFLGFSFAPFILDASFVAGAFFVAKPFVDCFGTGVKVLGDGSVVDYNPSFIINEFNSCK